MPLEKLDDILKVCDKYTPLHKVIHVRVDDPMYFWLRLEAERRTAKDNIYWSMSDLIRAIIKERVQNEMDKQKQSPTGVR